MTEQVSIRARVSPEVRDWAVEELRKNGFGYGDDSAAFGRLLTAARNAEVSILVNDGEITVIPVAR